MKTHRNSRGPDRSQVLAELEAVISLIDRTRARCEQLGKPGSVELLLAREHALRARFLVNQSDSSDRVDWTRVARNTAAVTLTTARLYSLLFCFLATNEDQYARGQTHRPVSTRSGPLAA